MLAGVKLIDKAAAEKALKQEERARKEEKKQLKKATQTLQSDGLMTSCRMQMCTCNGCLDCNESPAPAGEESSAETEAQAG